MSKRKGDGSLQRLSARLDGGEKPYVPPKADPIPWAVGFGGRGAKDHLISGPSPHLLSTLVGDADALRDVLISMANLHPEKRVLALGYSPLKGSPGWTWEEAEGVTKERVIVGILVKLLQALQPEVDPYDMILVNLDATKNKDLFEGVRDVRSDDGEREIPEWVVWSRYTPVLHHHLKKGQKTSLVFTTSRRSKIADPEGHRSLPRTAFKFYSHRIFSLLRLTNENFMEVKVMKDRIAPTTFWSYPLRRGEILSRAGVEAYTEEERKARGEYLLLLES